MSRLSPLSADQARALMSEQRTKMIPVMQLSSVFSASECQQIVGLRGHLGFDEARVEGRGQAGIGGGGLQREINASIRVTERTHLLHSPSVAWIYDRLAMAVEQANNGAWQFRLAYMEPPQLLRYPVGGHYAWHADLGSDGLLALRKVSVTVPLSAEDEYEGGGLEIQSGSRVLRPKRTQGSAIVFPSFQPHRVTPVTRGERFSIVLWVLGKRSLR